MGLKNTPRIIVRSAIGYGPTELGAFDSALRGTGVNNFNIIRLSSVIPPGCVVEVGDAGSALRPDGEWGDRLYAVYAEQRASHPDDTVCAGVGWVQDATGRGLFVEHEGPTRYGVERDIEMSLRHLVAERGGGFGEIRMNIIDGQCRPGLSVCALVVAAYQAESW